MTVEIGTDVVRCHHCGSSVLIEMIACEGKRIGAKVIVEIHHTADTKAALEYHGTGRCLQ